MNYSAIIVRFSFHMAFLLAVANMQGCGGPPRVDQEKPLLIATAANVKFAMEEIKEAFEMETGSDIELVFSSSGKLNAQISQGAPYDIFVSANMLYPQTLFDNGYAIEAPRVYALGALVVWTLEDLEVVAEPALFTSPDVQKIAIANPRNAPYGEEAVNVLRHFGIFDEVKSKLVFGESIAQANQYILSRSCDIGITAKSIVLAPKLRDVGRWAELPPDAYSPIRQGIVVTRYGKETHPELTSRFMDFIFSENARKILRGYGYSIPVD